MLNYDHFVLESNENYRKGSFRNRCFIASANGVIGLSIPLKKGKHQQSNIKKVEIDYSRDWQAIHWKTLKTAYNNSAYFYFYEPYLKEIFQNKITYLFDLCLNVQELMLKLLDIQPNISFTNEFNLVTEENTQDGRNQNLPKNYKNIILPENHPDYQQVFEDKFGFQPNLSILDLLFCCGPESQEILRSIKI